MLSYNDIFTTNKIINLFLLNLRILGTSVFHLKFFLFLIFCGGLKGLSYTKLALEVNYLTLYIVLILLQFC